MAKYDENWQKGGGLTAPECASNMIVANINNLKICSNLKSNLKVFIERCEIVSKKKVNHIEEAISF